MKEKIVIFGITLICSLIIAGCEKDPVLIDDTIPISGTITIYRNGEAWSNNFSLDSQNIEVSENNILRTPKPREQLFRVFIIKNENGNNYSIGGTDKLELLDAEKGIYQWTMRITPVSFPQTLYFSISGGIMGGVYNGNKHIITIEEGFYIENDKEILDLGTVYFKTVKVSINIPIKIIVYSFICKIKK